MSKRTPFEIMIELIGRFPQGASLEEILVGLDPAISRRTLQRWLAALVSEGRLVATGQARARRYQLTELKEKEKTFSEGVIPLSLEAREIYNKVAQPLYARRPVTYQREFLDGYQPNRTYYLSADVRQRLRVLSGRKEEKYPAGTYARQIFHRLLIDLSWNSSRLEGNTYSLLETERLLESGKAATGKDLKETQMILNHKAAIEFLIDSADEIGVNRYTLLNLHTLLSDNLMPDPASCGRLRTSSVGITHSAYLPTAIPQLIEECFDLLIFKAGQIEDPFEQAFFLMVQLPYLQPFDDVNKRTSRLAANIPLIQKNLCPLSFIDVPQEMYINGLLGVYELNQIGLLRDVFIGAYERSCSLYATTIQSLGEPDPFRMRYREELKIVIGEIIRNKMGKMQAVTRIRAYASQSVSLEDRSRFIETVERELRSLHEGNIARYQLKPAEYTAWRDQWV